MANVTVKKDPALLALAAVVVIAAAVLFGLDKITWKETVAFLIALGLPSIFGAASSKDDAKDPPDDPPSVGGAGAGALLVICAFLGLTACASASRAQARGAVLATAEAIRVGDKLCAEVALDKNDLALARTCEGAYTEARPAVLIAADAVDAWDEGKRGTVACAVKRAADAVGTTTKALKARSVAVPKLLDDAIALVSTLGGCS